MAAGTLTTLDSALQNVYPSHKMPNFFNQNRPLFERIRKITDKKQFSGRQFIFAARDSYNQAIGPGAEGGTLPTRGANSYVNMTLATKYYYGIVGLSAQAIAASKTQEGAFARLLDDNVMGTKDELLQDMTRDAVYGAGFGEIGRIAGGGVSGTTITMETQPTVVNMPGNRFFRKNMTVESYTALTAGSAGASARTVVTVPAGTATITVDANTGMTAGDYFFRNGGRGNAMMGLRGIADNGTHLTTFQGLTRSSNPGTNANVLSNAGALRAWTPELMDAMFIESWNNGGGGWPSAAYSRVEIQQRAAAYLRADRRADMKEMQLNNGWKSIAWMTPDGEKPWIADQYVVPNQIFALKEEDLFWAMLEELQWEDADGAIWRFTDRTHTYEAWLFSFLNLGAWQCNNHTVLKDVSHTA